MKRFGFTATRGYEIWKGYVTADSKVEAEKLINDEQWDDIIDEYDSDCFTEGFEVIEIWECNG